MNMLNIPLVFAFIAGLISFLSPCVLPLIPGYLAYLAGSSTAEEKPRQIDLFMSSVFSVLGFALVFAVMGVLLNTILKDTAYSVQMWLSRLGGLVIIIFGLFLTGLLQILSLRGNTGSGLSSIQGCLPLLFSARRSP